MELDLDDDFLMKFIAKLIEKNLKLKKEIEILKSEEQKELKEKALNIRIENEKIETSIYGASAKVKDPWIEGQFDCKRK